MTSGKKRLSALIRAFLVLICVFACPRVEKASVHYNEYHLEGDTSYEGKVVEVTSGNTFIFASDRAKFNVGLIGISVPSGDKPLAKESQEFFSHLALGATVEVLIQGNLKDHNRTILLGKLLLEKRDIGLELLREGFGWLSAKPEQLSQTDSRLYAEAQQRAFTTARGIWGKAFYQDRAKSKSSASMTAGLVRVEVLVDEIGNVIRANALCGRPQLQEAAVAAALKSKFTPTYLSGQAVKVNGVIEYNFLPK